MILLQKRSASRLLLSNQNSRPIYLDDDYPHNKFCFNLRFDLKCTSSRGLVCRGLPSSFRTYRTSMVSYPLFFG